MPSVHAPPFLLTDSFVFDPAPPGRIVSDVLRPAQRQAAAPASFIQKWNIHLQAAEDAVWEPAGPDQPTVPTYAQRSRGDLGGHDDVSSVRMIARPEDEKELTAQVVAFLQPLLTDVFKASNDVLLEKDIKGLPSKVWAAGRDIGWGTTDMSMRQPLDMSDEEWSLVLNFVNKYKLMPKEVRVRICGFGHQLTPSQDLEGLVCASQRVNTRPTEHESLSEPESSQNSTTSGRSPPATGFSLWLEGDAFNTDTDMLPPGLEHVLPQVSKASNSSR